MLQARVYDRVGPSEVLGGAWLDGHRLEFNKPNMKNKEEGLANLVEAAGESVFGVLYELTPKQLEQLEGYFGGYGRRPVEVRLSEKDGERRSATTFSARRTKSGLRPTRSTLDITEKAARENDAPSTVVEALKRIEALND